LKAFYEMLAIYMLTPAASAGNLQALHWPVYKEN